MPENELLYGLIALGAGGVLLVLGYNTWQERKHRRTAEKAFRSDHRDVLLEGDAPSSEIPDPLSESGCERIEPASSRIPPAPPIGRAMDPELPVEARAIDCVIRIEAPAGVEGGALVAGAGGPLSQISRPIHWYGLSDETHQWLQLETDETGSFTRFAVAMQLADRRGAIAERDYDIFTTAVQRVCDQFLAVPHIPSREETLELAERVDQFCAAMDVQIALNVVASEQPFAGTKIRGLAEAAGLKLERDGCFHARDDDGNTEFVMSNRDVAVFSTESLKQMASSGLTIAIDVPRVADDVHVFDRMVMFARHMADALDGRLVDDNRREIGEQAIALIRGQVQEFHQQMDESGVPAGSFLAQRLFS